MIATSYLILISSLYSSLWYYVLPLQYIVRPLSVDTVPVLRWSILRIIIILPFPSCDADSVVIATTWPQHFLWSRCITRRARQ